MFMDISQKNTDMKGQVMSSSSLRQATGEVLIDI